MAAATGRNAVYKSGEDRVLVYVYRATKLEKEALFRRAYDQLAPDKDSNISKRPIHSGRQGFRGVTGEVKGNVLSFELYPGSDPNPYGILWWDKDWLFLVRGTRMDPDHFFKDYLATLSESRAHPLGQREGK